jgi:hypothetical protein
LGKEEKNKEAVTARGEANGRRAHLACAAEEEEDQVDIMRYSYK